MHISDTDHYSFYHFCGTIYMVKFCIDHGYENMYWWCGIIIVMKYFMFGKRNCKLIEKNDLVSCKI